MSFTKITNSDLNNKGVMGLADTPGLSASEMQRKLDEIAKEVIVPKYNELVDELNGNGVANNSKIIDPVDDTEKNLQTTINSLKGYVDVKKTEANTYTDEKCESTLTSAKNYTDEYGIENLRLAKLYADDVGKAANDFANKTAKSMYNMANNYTDTACVDTKQLAVVESNSYTDDKFSIFDNIKSVSETLIGANDNIPTGKAVADALGRAGYGDMLKSTYDKDNDGKVDSAENADTADNANNAENANKLNNHTEDYFASKDWVDKKVIEKTWAEFVALKESRKLIPGKYYKITDRGIDFLMEANRIGCADAEGNRSNVQTQLDKSFDEIANLPMFIKKPFTATSNSAGAFQISEIPYQYTVIDIVVTSANSKTINLKQYDNRGFWVVNSSGSVMGNETISGVAIGIANLD